MNDWVCVWVCEECNYTTKTEPAKRCIYDRWLCPACPLQDEYGDDIRIDTFYVPPEKVQQAYMIAALRGYDALCNWCIKHRYDVWAH